VQNWVVLVVKSFTSGGVLCSSSESRLPVMSDEELISNLCELFSQVDVNGDGELEWEEFSSFVLEMGMNKIGASGNTDSIKEYKEGRVVDRSARSIMTAQMKWVLPYNLIVDCHNYIQW
jgi:hypothetical protein